MTIAEDLLKGAFVESTCRSPRRVTRNDGTVVFIRCESTQARLCPSCARLRQIDQMRLIGSGCNTSDRDGVTEQHVAGYKFWFITLTAPSFGPVHRVPKTERSRPVQCGCGLVHKHGDVLKGVPIKLKTYRYREQIEWNDRVNRLAKLTMDKLRELLPESEYAFVREWQARGVIHLHGIVRVPEWMEDSEVMSSLMSLKAVKDNGATWGREIDVRPVDTGQTGNSVRYMSKVVAYTSKQQGESDGVLPEARRRHYNRLDWHARRLRCGKRNCGKRCRGKKHREFGHTGHMMTMSKGWSFVGLTRTALVEQRKEYAASHRSDAVQQATLKQASQYRKEEIEQEMKPADDGQPQVKQDWRKDLLGAVLSQAD